MISVRLDIDAAIINVNCHCISLLVGSVWQVDCRANTVFLCNAANIDDHVKICDTMRHGCFTGDLQAAHRKCLLVNRAAVNPLHAGVDF